MSDAHRSPFADKQEELGVEWEEDGGWLWANTFAGDEGGLKAYTAVREDAGVWDVSPLIKYKFKGPDAAKAADYIQSNNIVSLKDGGVRYGAARGWVDAIIDPAHTRDALITALEAAALNPDIREFKTGVLQT
jgi:glycine cleavage system aminomethyltransferase T